MISEQAYINKIKNKRKMIIWILITIFSIVIPSTILTVNRIEKENKKIEKAITMTNQAIENDSLDIIIKSVANALKNLQKHTISLAAIALLGGFAFNHLFNILKGQDRDRIIVCLWEKIDLLEKNKG